MDPQTPICRMTPRFVSLLFAVPLLSFAAQPLLVQPAVLVDSAGVVRRAKAALAEPIVRITDKHAPSPSGDPHDYISYSRYWWPDPSKPGGLPYVRHDGHHNMEQVNRGDINRLEKFADTVQALATGWARTGNPEFANRAGEWLRAWFVDPSTRMNPSLDYSQIRLGHGGNKGTKSGVLDGRRLLRALDAFRILEDSGVLKPGDLTAVRAWFADYYSWLKTSTLGRAEADSKNNHGTWCLVQELALAIQLGGKDDITRLSERARGLIESQILPDGSQPLELARVDGLSYSTFNLEAHMQLASLARSAGVDLYHFTPKRGGGLKAAIEYLRPYNSAPETWKGHQNAKVKPGFLDPVLSFAARLDSMDGTK